MVKSVSSFPGRWLLFMPQLPAKPDYARVKLWRRLQPLGAVPLRHGVYALPSSDDAREDLEWVGKEVEADGGSVVICEAALIDGMNDAELAERFRERASYSYRDIAARARKALGDAGSATVARRLRTLLATETKRDVFGAPGRKEAELALAALEAGTQRKSADVAAGDRAAPRPQGSVWVTRAGVFVDRIASAWLIRRFIDRKAKFKFVTTARYAPRPNERRFDMYQAEHTHRGDACTFEVLLADFALTNPALEAIAEIVHDIDLKDERYGRPEADGIAQLLHGLTIAEPDDAKRLRAGAQIFDSLFARFSASP